MVLRLLCREEMTTSTESIFELKRNCCAITHANRVACIVDAEAYFSAFVQAAKLAQQSIVILAWDFNSRTLLAFGDDGSPTLLLGDFLNDLARRRRGLQIHVLDWDYPMIFGTDREFPPVYGMSWKPHKRVHFRYDGTHPTGGSHHQKIVTIDGKLAFVGGLDLTAKRWDTPSHRPDDARRQVDGSPYPPFHDVMIAVDGKAAAAIDGIARKRWHKATGETLSEPQAQGERWPDDLLSQIADAHIGVACTAPESEKDKGVRDIEQLYLDMIARAKDYIYIENQYFTAPRIGDALAARLAEPDGPEVVLVTRLLSHGWLEEMTMHVLRTRLIKSLSDADHAGRFEVYYPHVDGLKEGTCVDVHSKVMIVDDKWLRIGSSNISNRSMGMDTECDVVVEAQGNEEQQRAIREFRDAIVAEHAGVEPAEVKTAVEREGGLVAAINTLGTPARKLEPLGELPQYSDSLIDAVSISDPERPVSLDALIGEFETGPEPKKRRVPWRKVGVALLAVLALTLAWKYTALSDWVSMSNATEWASRYADNWWAPVLLILLYTPASVIMFPRPILTLTAVFVFGAWPGIAYAMTGVLLAVTVHYYAGRQFKRDTVRRFAGGRLNRITDVLRRYGAVAMTAVRLVPLAPFFVPGLVAGAIRMKLWQALVGTFLGMLPGAIATVVFAEEMKAALEEGGQINYGMVAGVVVMFAAIIYGVRRWFKRIDLGPVTSDRKAVTGDGKAVTSYG